MENKKLSKLEVQALLGFQARERELQELIKKASEQLKNNFNEIMSEVAIRLEISLEDLTTKYKLDLDTGDIKLIEEK